MRWVVLAVGLAASGSAVAADRISYGPAPKWVSTAPITATPLPAKDADAEPANPALSFLESDSQSKFTAADVSEFVSFKVKVNTAAGLSIGGFSRSWDPATDVLAIHRLRIERDGEVIDVLRKQKFETLRRESNLEMAMLDGRLTATLQIADLRVGDVVDFAMTLTRAQPVMAGRNSDMSSFSARTKVGKARVRMVWDAAAPVRWRAGSGLPTPRTITTPSGGEMLFEAVDFTGPTVPERSPARYRTLGMIEASQVDGWPSVSKAFTPLFARAAQLAPNSPLRAEVERIRREGKTPLEQAGLALKLVEDQVRYVAIMVNAQGYTPAAADETWRRRFGDCKGKTALLMALLRELGVEAAPVLVNTFGGDSLSAVLPRADAFDHVIVRARIDGKDYWLDGTRTGDGALETLEPPNFGWVLPLTAEGAELERLRPPRPTRPLTQYTLRMDASKGFGVETPVTLEVISRSRSAGALAQSMASQPKAQLERNLIRRYESTYDRTRFTEVSWRYDEAQSRIVYTLKGTKAVDVQVMAGRNRFEIPGSEVSAPDLELRPKDQDQTVPYDGDDSSYVRRLTVIQLPNGGKGYEMFGAPILTVLGGGQRLRWAASEDGVVTMVRSFRGVAEEVSAEQMALDVETARRMRSTVSVITSAADAKEALAADGIAPQAPAGETPYEDARGRLGPWAYSAGREQQARMARLSDEKRDELMGLIRTLGTLYDKEDHAGLLRTLDTTRLDLAPLGDTPTEMRVMALQRLKRDAEALAVADRAIARVRSPSTLLLRATLHRASGRSAAARADLEAALALDPENIGALQDLTADPDIRKDPEALVKLRRRIVALMPDEPEERILLGRAEAAAGRRAEALLAYQDAEETGAMGASVPLARAELLQQMGRPDEALAAWDTAVALRPNQAVVLNNACWGRATLERQLDKALGECERAVKIAPKAPAYRDSLAFVKLRQGRFADAVGDYDLALAADPKLSASLYGRGIAKLRLGQTAAGQADLAAARALDDAIDKQFAGYGIKP